jgi:hypothetical protein
MIDAAARYDARRGARLASIAVAFACFFARSLNDYGGRLSMHPRQSC